MESSRISRVLQIVTALQSDQSNRVDDLAKLFNVSRRTILRDLKELRAIAVPCRYDAKARRYRIESDFFLPSIDLNLEEVLSLLLLARKVSNEIQLPFTRSVLLAALKIENNLPLKVRQYCRTVLQSISIRKKPHVRQALDDATFSRLQRAISRSQLVEIRYDSPSEGTNISITLRPYHLVYAEYMWHVIAYSSFHSSVRVFRLCGIKEPVVLDKHFSKPEFDVKDYFGRAWSMRPEGRLYNIKLWFVREVAKDVAEVEWHSTQKVTFEDDGSAIVEFRVDGLNEITWWILSYGDRVQVLAPKTLRGRIVTMAQGIVRINK